MANQLERWLANSLMNADKKILIELVRQDANLIEWSFLRWRWLESVCRGLKPFFIRTFLEVRSENVLCIVNEARPDLIPYIERRWLDRQVVYAKWRVTKL